MSSLDLYSIIAEPGSAFEYLLKVCFLTPNTPPVMSILCIALSKFYKSVKKKMVTQNIFVNAKVLII